MVMLQHLESIQVIVNALVEENYELAKGLTESHMGFFMHRQAMPKGAERSSTGRVCATTAMALMGARANDRNLQPTQPR
jgi:hypothetical protein